MVYGSDAVMNEREELARLRQGIALFLAAIGLLAAAAAVLGLPLLFVVGRGASNVARFEGIYRSEYAAWVDHDGWAWSGAAWFYAAFALAAFAGAALVAGMIRVRGARAVGLVSGPAVLVLALGPLLQHLSGAGWSTYSDVGNDFLPYSVVFTVVLLVFWCLAVGAKLTREHRRSRTVDETEARHRGTRRPGRHHV